MLIGHIIGYDPYRVARGTLLILGGSFCGLARLGGLSAEDLFLNRA